MALGRHQRPTVEFAAQRPRTLPLPVARQRSTSGNPGSRAQQAAVVVDQQHPHEEGVLIPGLAGAIAELGQRAGAAVDEFAGLRQALEIPCRACTRSASLAAAPRAASAAIGA